MATIYKNRKNVKITVQEVLNGIQLPKKGDKNSIVSVFAVVCPDCGSEARLHRVRFGGAETGKDRWYMEYSCCCRPGAITEYHPTPADAIDAFLNKRYYVDKPAKKYGTAA